MKNSLLFFLMISFTSVLMVACSSKDPDLERGEVVYTSACKVCHSQGINGAPVFGNNKNWAPRKVQGLDVLVEHASNGYGLMPAKGGRTELTEDDIRAAIKYMLAALDEK
jgi:cytochrome c5